VILGGSGSGKSTLLRTLVGSGKAEARGRFASRAETRKKPSAAEWTKIRRKDGMILPKAAALFVR